jgi:AraC-like DNA-binding protein
MPTDERHEHRYAGPLGPLVPRANGYLHTGHAPGRHVGMPSLTLTFVVPFDEPLRLSDGRSAPVGFAGVVAGLHTAPTYIHHDGHQHGVQLALEPTAARALLGCPASALAESSYDLDDVLPAWPGWRDRLADASPAERFTLLAEVLAPRETTPLAAELVEAWRLVRASDGSLPVHAIAERVGWSVRHLQHVFRAELGLTPKQALRIRRFERSVPLVAHPPRRLADVAAACGYADQAHLAREWRALAGVAPSRWPSEDDLAFVQDDDAPLRAASVA